MNGENDEFTGACSGKCCERFVFFLSRNTLEGWADFCKRVDEGSFLASDPRAGRSYAEEGRYVRDMLIPLGINEHGNLEFTCKHYDADTRRCKEYAARPAMCSGYPYRGSSCDNTGCTLARVCRPQATFLDGVLDGPVLKADP